MYFIGSSVFPLIIVLLLGGFALLILKNFVTKMPTMKRIERKVEDTLENEPEEAEPEEDTPRVDLEKKEIASKKNQSINELNDAVMSAPEEAAKLLVSYIKN